MKTYLLPANTLVDVLVENVGWTKIFTTHAAFLTHKDLLNSLSTEAELERYVGKNGELYFMFQVEGITFQVSSKNLMLIWPK